MSSVSPELLSRCLEDIRSGASSVEGCLSAHPEARDELESLLRLALAIESTPDVSPDPSFRARGRAQLLAAIAAERRQQAAEAMPRRLLRALGEGWAALVARRTLAPVPLALALVFLLSFGSVGAVFAAQEALPGDPLYGVKRAGEELQLRLAASEENRLRLHVELADKRLREMLTLAEQNRFGPIGEVADAYAAHLEQASALAERNAAGEQQRERVHERLMEQEQRLLQVQASAPKAAQPALVRALAQVQQYDHGVRVGWERKGQLVEPSPTATPPAGDAQQVGGGSGPAADPGVELSALVAEVEGLAADDDVARQGRQDLLAKLAAARDALDRGQIRVAANTLAAFAHHLNALARSGNISGEDYDLLYDAYTKLAERLGDTPVPTADVKPHSQPASPDAAPRGRDEPGGAKPGQGTGAAERGTPTPTPADAGASLPARDDPRGPGGRP